MRGKIVIIGGMLALAGCATAHKNIDMEMQGLRTHVSELESQLQQRDTQLIALQEALDTESKERTSLATQLSTLTEKYKSVSHTGSVKQIQIALQNAGYDVGKVDGVVGGKTRSAVRDFQKANSLKITGKVDKETWLLLRQYLHKKVK